MKEKNKVLLILKLPPPLTGATIMNEFVHNSSLLHSNFQIKTLSVSYKNFIGDTQIFSLRKIAVIFAFYIKLIRHLLQFSPQLIYFQISPTGIGFFRDCSYILIMKAFRKHIVFHMHGKGIKEYVGNSKIKSIIYRWAFRKSTVICLSDKLLYDIADVYPGTPYIVNNAIRISPNNKTPRVQKDKFLNILFLSNLIVSKGLFIFLDALALLNNKQIKVQANIVGQEVEIKEKELLKEIKIRDLENNVTYLGALYNNEKEEVYHKSDILVYPTFNDVWGLVILEAMQAGIPVLATQEGAIPEMVVDGVTGFIVDKHNPEQIAERLEFLINNKELREAMGRAGRERFLERYTFEIFEKNMTTVFKDVFDKLNKSV